MLSPYIPDIPLGTIQQQALDWLVNNDDSEGLIPSQNSGRLLDRYVLAILYLSTNGDGWSRSNEGWMSEASVCTWYIYQSSTTDGNICPQSNGRVNQIYFGKYLFP